MFGYTAWKVDQLSERVQQLNMLHLAELGRLHQRVAVLEQELADRKAKEAQSAKEWREKTYHGVG